MPSKAAATAGARKAGATRAGKKPAGKATKAAQPKPKRPPKRTPEEIARAWAEQLERERPGLAEWTIDRLSAHFGKPVWQRAHDPTSELIVTILSASNSDINAEHAFELLRAAYPSVPPQVTDDHSPQPRDGWGGKGIANLPPPDWAAVENAPLDELIDVIRPGGLGPSKAPRLQASLKTIREETGGYSLEFLGKMPALEAREWMRRIPGIGPKTASVVLLFSFGAALMPVDRHVERVSKRVGLLPPKEDLIQSHDTFLALLPPDRMYEGHVDLIRHGRAICHAQRPDCAHCPIAERCRYYHPDAP